MPVGRPSMPEADALNEPSSRCSTEDLLETRNVAPAVEFQERRQVSAWNGTSAVPPAERAEVAILDEEMPHHELCAAASAPGRLLPRHAARRAAAG